MSRSMIPADVPLSSVLRATRNHAPRGPASAKAVADLGGSRHAGAARHPHSSSLSSQLGGDQLGTHSLQFKVCTCVQHIVYINKTRLEKLFLPLYNAKTSYKSLGERSGQ